MPIMIIGLQVSLHFSGISYFLLISAPFQIGLCCTVYNKIFNAIYDRLICLVDPVANGDIRQADADSENVVDDKEGAGL